MITRRVKGIGEPEKRIGRCLMAALTMVSRISG
jgi:hypothetical protein